MSRLTWPLVSALAAAFACGSPGEARSPSERHPAGGEGSRGSTALPSEGEPEAPEVDCEDGTCISCGDAFCPNGFFCDETSAPATCAWLPECAEEATCACVKKVLTSCSCEDRDGAYVTCE